MMKMRHDVEMNAFAKKLNKRSPVDCKFKIGDKVSYTNDYGVTFDGHTVIGFAEDTGLYGNFIYLDLDCYWYATKPNKLSAST
jgi:hypothetical protein